MRSSAVLFAVLALSATPVLAQAAAPTMVAPTMVAPTMVAPTTIAKSGTMLRSADKARLGPVSRVNSDGSVQIIFDANVKTIPASTLSMVDGKLTTSLTKSAVTSLR